MHFRPVKHGPTHPDYRAREARSMGLRVLEVNSIIKDYIQKNRLGVES